MKITLSSGHENRQFEKLRRKWVAQFASEGMLIPNQCEIH